MCHLNDGYGYTLAVDLIDDAIRTFSNSVSVLGALQLARADRMWVCCKSLNRGNDSGIMSLGSFLSSLAAERFHSISSEAIPFQLGNQILVGDSWYVTPFGRGREILNVLD